MSGVFDDVVEYGPGGFDPAKPNGNIVRTRQVEVHPRVANERQLVQRAQTALSDNATFLALGTPTAAQNAAQMKRLTRQMNALIRITLCELADIADS